MKDSCSLMTINVVVVGGEGLGLMSDMLKGVPWTLLLSLHTGHTILSDSREQILCSGLTHPPACLLRPGSTHLRDPRTTSNPSSPSSSPQTPSALGSGISDPVLNGGLCSAAFCGSAGGRYTRTQRAERESRPPPPHHHYHRGPSGSHYGIVSRCHPAVVRNNGRGFVVPPPRQLQLGVVKCSARVVLSPSTVMWVVSQTTRLPTHAW